ncbi:MAG TPA: magnesium and cobalt transport protein CorA [Acidimicrobiales bacterium]
MIVDCAVYDQGKRRPGQLAVDEAIGSLDGAGGAHSFVWIGLHDPTAAEFDEVASALELHPLAVEDAIKAHQRPKLERYGDSLFLVVKSARYVDEREAVDFAEIQLFVARNFLVTVRHGDACDLSRVRRDLDVDPERLARGPIAAVHGILDRVVDDYVPVLDGLDNDIAEIEADVFSEARVNPAARIYKLKRQVLNLYRAVEPLLEPLEQLHTGAHPLAQEGLSAYFRDVDDHLRRVAARIEVQRDLLSDVLQVNLSHISVQQNDDMRRIASWAAIAAVPTMLAGVWGMNFDHMPELHETWGYPFALGLIVVVACLLYRYLRHQGWI